MARNWPENLITVRNEPIRLLLLTAKTNQSRHVTSLWGLNLLQVSNYSSLRSASLPLGAQLLVLLFIQERFETPLHVI